MKLSPAWLREFVDAKVDDRRLAQDLTAVGIAVESISGEGKNTVFEMEIGTNRPDAMNHYGMAREASVIYNVPLRTVDSKLPAAPGNSDFVVEIVDNAGCARYTARVVRDVNI
ncbi:MAG: phenylalanine--tRNA ligase subunit beta, partial [Candidatus Angelobacter sp.]